MSLANGSVLVDKASLRAQAKAIRAAAHRESDAAGEASQALAAVLISYLEGLSTTRRELRAAEAAGELRPSYLAGMYDEPEHLPVHATLGTLWPWRPTNNRSIAAQLSPMYPDAVARSIAEKIRATRWPNVAPDVLARLKAAEREAQQLRSVAELDAADASAEEALVIRVAAYAAIGTELSLAPFARALADGLADGTQVQLYAPVVLGPAHMEFVPVSAEELADPAASGLDFLAQPAVCTQAPKDRAFEPCTNLDVILVPGLAFAEDGARLGYGGGYYDAYLSMYRAQQRWAGSDMGSWPQPRPTGEGRAVGVVYEQQLLAAGTIPTDAHDQPVFELATPAGLRRLG